MGVSISSQKSLVSRSVVTDLVKITSFSKQEVKAWYSNFRIDFPCGYLTVDDFEKIYADLFPQGDVSAFARSMFCLFDRNNDTKINFREFIIALSVLTRENVEDRAR